MRLAGLVVLGIWFWSSPAWAAYHVFQIPHLAGDAWITALTVYNEGDRSAFVRLRQWSEAGIQGLEGIVTIPVHGKHSWNQADLLPEGMASLTTEVDQVRVKLTYQHRLSQSLHELFVTPDASSTQWLVPNAHAGVFSWLSIAVANFGRQTTTLSMTAFKDGAEIKSQSFPLKPGRKRMASSTQLWDLECNELDAVLITSDKPIPAPLIIAETCLSG